MLISRGVWTLFLIFFLTHSSVCVAKPEALAALFQVQKPSKKKSAKTALKVLPQWPIPAEYEVYFKAKAVLNNQGPISAIESTERQILQQRLTTESKNLDKDLEEVFYALELKRGTQFAQKKAWAPAFASFNRGVTGLTPYKWIFYWTESSSKALASICSRKKKSKDEACLTLAKKIADAFPKSAQETKILRDLPSFEPSYTNETNNDRLSQSYTEKTEKDEEAFKDLLDAFLHRRKSEVLKLGKEFQAGFPKSILRFRAQFLMAEMLYANNDKKEAREKYLSIIQEVPLSFYAIVAAERLGIDLTEKVSRAPISIDDLNINPNLTEQLTLRRAGALFLKNHFDEVGIELDTLTRTRSYTTDFILYLMKFATESNQNLTAFHLANELIQRKYDGLLNQEFISLIFPDRFYKEISLQATLNQIDPLVVISLIKQESGFKAPILSSSGAMGLMQLMPFTAIDTKKDVVLSTLREPAENLAVGTKYIAGLLQLYDGNVPYALAAYNAGPHRVAKWRKDEAADYTMIEWIESIPFKETRDYVMAILRNRYWYQYRHKLQPESIFSVWKMPAAKIPVVPPSGNMPVNPTATTAP